MMMMMEEEEEKERRVEFIKFLVIFAPGDIGLGKVVSGFELMRSVQSLKKMGPIFGRWDILWGKNAKT